MGFSPHINYSSDGVCVIDVALNVHGKRVALSIDGPQCFSANAPYAPLGETVARWRLIQSRGWKVVSIRYSDWIKLNMPHQQQAHLHQTISAASTRAPQSLEGVIPVLPSKAPKAWTLHRLYRLLDF